MAMEEADYPGLESRKGFKSIFIARCFMKRIAAVVLVVFAAVSALAAAPALPGNSGVQAGTADKSLMIVWTTGEKDVFTKMAGPYLAVMAKSWTQRTLMIWGPSEKLAAEDADVQALVQKLKESGVILKACKWCAEQYGVDKKLAELGFEVNYMGGPLTEAVQSGMKVLTF